MHKKLHIVVVSGKMAWGPGGQAEEGDVFFTFVLFEFYSRHVLSNENARMGRQFSKGAFLGEECGRRINEFER